jgi:hypothetical protein
MFFRNLTFNELHGVIYTEDRTLYNHRCENPKSYKIFHIPSHMDGLRSGDSGGQFFSSPLLEYGTSIPKRDCAVTPAHFSRHTAFPQPLIIIHILIRYYFFSFRMA